MTNNLDEDTLGKLVDFIYDDLRVNLLMPIGARVGFENYDFQNKEFTGGAYFYFGYEHYKYLVI